MGETMRCLQMGSVAPLAPVVGRVDEREVVRLVEERTGEPESVHPPLAGRTQPENVSSGGFAEDEILVDVRLEQDGSCDDGHVAELARIAQSPFVSADAGER